jgi:GNAT superfamily N-acetyltransferase
VILLVRDAVREDAETLLEIHRAAAIARFSNVFPQKRHPFPTDAVRARWQAFFDDRDNHALLAEEEEGRAIGMAAIMPGWLDALYVLPEEWGKGVGSRLYDEAVERLRAFGSAEARLWVLERNGRARSFYEDRGWRLDGRRRSVPSPPFPVDVGYTLLLR